VRLLASSSSFCDSPLLWVGGGGGLELKKLENPWAESSGLFGLRDLNKVLEFFIYLSCHDFRKIIG
jgi:hypothetical protein